MADLTDLNPAFLPLLNAYTAALDKAGIGYRFEQGYRTPEQAAQFHADVLAGRRAGPAADAWRSFHNYGMAADIAAINQADYPKMHELARQAGLYDAQGGLGFTGYDPPHVEMPGSLSDLINQYHLAGWRPADRPAPATGAIAYSQPSARPSRVASIAPGTTLNSTPLDIVLQAESGDRNINNTTQGTSSGQAQGFAQITTGTWSDFAPKAGVDLKKYPTPDSAPRDVQIAVANTIPLNRWASSTVNKVLAKYPGIDTTKTLGEIQSAALGGASGGSQTAAGGNSAAGATGQPGTPQGQLAGFKPGSPAEASMKAAAKSLGADQTSQAPDLPSPPPLPQAQAMGGAMMMPPGGQNMLPRQLAAQTMPYGISLANLTPQTPQQPMAPPGMATGVPAMPGTTLNSPSQLQMALMTGAMNPYDLYGAGSGGYGGGYQGSA